ncbi:hypothetical protein GCM10010121_089080 [Streptomyces brasiliensis]|uniref:non-specific serine/threonine protein kinase n=2 Tax=Streptomyces brasiliensis TaxID=1954 RepID=A0A917P6U3_9ACTN|nr:hypothetical protein GCM10010121_089080 [Streptomyces brasiliensis]
MGEVWTARDRELHRTVAIKLLQPDDNAPPEFLQRFEREAVAAAQINHPHIAALYDRGTHEDIRFLTMEHIEGTSLAKYLHVHGPLPVDRALKIAEEICAALIAAHAANIVHYDIKPSNVVLTRDGTVKVVDFGIAGFIHTHTFTVAPTTLLSPIGTAQYGAPEQFLDHRGDTRSDLYALGSVLFALLTGQPPFGDGSPLSVIRRKLDEEARRVTDLRAEVSAPVADLLADLLQRDPERRPGTAAAVHGRLMNLRRNLALVDTELVGPLAALAPPTVPRTAVATDPAPPLPSADTPQGHGTNIGPPSGARPVPQGGTASRAVQIGVAVLLCLAGIAAGIAYFSGALDHKHAPPDEKATQASVVAKKFLRMPDLCGYLRSNDMHGYKELGAYDLSSSANTSKKANCGWTEPDTANGDLYDFILTVSAELLDTSQDAAKAMAKITPGRSEYGPMTTSEVSGTEDVPDGAMQAVRDEERDKGRKHNFTSVDFRQANLRVTVEWSNWNPTHDTKITEQTTSQACRVARMLSGFLEDEPENKERPVWG